MFGDDRAQAYTLEGFIGSILILTAVLFALQSIVITPTTAGTVDREARDQVRVEANDILTLGAESGNLSAMTRYWNGTETDGDRKFASSEGANIGYSDTEPPDGAPGGTVVLLNKTFLEKNGYNVLVAFQNEDGTRSDRELTMVRNGFGTESAVVATYTLTLYDDQKLLGPGGDQHNLTWYDTVPDNGANGYYPIPDAYPNSPVYNIVVVKVVVW